MRKAYLFSAAYQIDQDIKAFAAIIIIPHHNTAPLENLLVEALPKESIIFEYTVAELTDLALEDLYDVALMKGLVF